MVLVGAAAAAAWLPVRRAARLDPLAAHKIEAGQVAAVDSGQQVGRFGKHGLGRDQGRLRSAEELDTLPVKCLAAIQQAHQCPGIEEDLTRHA